MLPAEVIKEAAKSTRHYFAEIYSLMVKNTTPLQVVLKFDNATGNIRFTANNIAQTQIQPSIPMGKYKTIDASKQEPSLICSDAFDPVRKIDSAVNLEGTN